MQNQANHAFESLTWFDVNNRIPSEYAAERWLIENRWPNGARCPECGHAQVRKIEQPDRVQFVCNDDYEHRFGVADDTVIELRGLSHREWALLFYAATNRVDEVSRIALISLARVNPEDARRLLDLLQSVWRDVSRPAGTHAQSPQSKRVDDLLAQFDDRSGYDFPEAIDVDPADLATAVLNACPDKWRGFRERPTVDELGQLDAEGWVVSDEIRRSLTCIEFLSGLPFRLGAAAAHLRSIVDSEDRLTNDAHFKTCLLFLSSVKEKFRMSLDDEFKEVDDAICDFRNGFSHELEDQTKRSLILEKDADDGNTRAKKVVSYRVPRTDVGAAKDRAVAPFFSDPNDEGLHDAIKHMILVLDAEIRKRWAEFSTCRYCTESTPVDLCDTCCQVRKKVWRGDRHRRPWQPKTEPRKCDRCQAA